MARTGGLLSGLDSNFNMNMANTIGGLGQGIMTGLGQVGAGIGEAVGSERLAKLDMRPQGVKLKERFAELTASEDPKDQKELLQVMSQMGASNQDIVAMQQMQVEKMKMNALKTAEIGQRNALVSTAQRLGLTSTIESLQAGGSIEEAQKTIYKEQERQTVNKGGRQGKLAIAQNKNVNSKMIARIKNGQFDEMTDETFIKLLEGKKATLKAFTNAQGEVQSRRVDDSANVWNPKTSKWESPMDLGLRPAPVVTKQISAADGITSKLTGKMLDNFLELNDEARNSLKILGTNEESITALNNAIEPGFTGDLKLELMRIGKAAGIVPEDMVDKVAATELFLKQRNSQVLPLIKNLGTGTAVSDNDVKFIKDIVGASVTLDDATIRSIIAIQNQGALDAIRLNNEALERLNTVEDTQLDQSVYQSLYIQPPETKNPMKSVLSNRARDYLNRIN
tara:strand:- start:3827 stop:5179 length:1353 start_codon:yes stop_codon:yes gene_type:complete